MILTTAVLLVQYTYACTIIVAGRSATESGHIIGSHSSDGDGFTDPRLVSVPRRAATNNSKRPIFFSPEKYPRYSGSFRNVSAYAGEEMQPIGYIPDVDLSYAYLEETYAIQNEKKLGIVESTCQAIFGTTAISQGGKALLSIDQLTQIALERHHSAQEAIKEIGALAVQYGFYGPGSTTDAGESLIIFDTQEAWIFQILPDPTGTSAIWAAQRVPDTHVAVVANLFTIREIDTESHDFMYSSSVFTVATSKGLWNDTQGRLDFARVYSGPEFPNKYDTGRRMWAAYSLLVPGSNLPVEYNDMLIDKPYPATLEATTKITRETTAQVMRDMLQGTQFDMTQGLAAGPFGSPDRYAASRQGEPKGYWERSIAQITTTDSFIIEARCGSSPGLIWFGPHGAHGTCYIPFVPDMQVPESFSIGSPHKLDRRSAYWAFKYVLNVAQIRYDMMSKDIQSAQALFEAISVKIIEKLDTKFNGRHRAYDQELSVNAERIVGAWWGLADVLIEKYADGFYNGLSMGYPAWWLDSVGFVKGEFEEVVGDDQDVVRMEVM